VLGALAAQLPDRPIAVARELTKLHEEVARGTAVEVGNHFAKGDVRGELVLVVKGIGKRRREHDE